MYPYLSAITVPSAFVLYGFFWKFFDKYAWKWRFVRTLFGVKAPILKGSWEALMRSTLDDPSQTFAGKIWIEQTWSTILISYNGPTAISQSHSASIKCLSEKQMALTYIYQSENRPQATQEEYIHFGTCRVLGDIETNGTVEMLQGSYFTDRSRKSYGEIIHQRVKPGVQEQLEQMLDNEPQAELEQMLDDKGSLQEEAVEGLEDRKMKERPGGV
jgi:hypothetical protein